MSRNKKIYAASLSLVLALGVSAFAQSSTTQTSTTQTNTQDSNMQTGGNMQNASAQTSPTRNVESGKKFKFRGIITDRQGDTLTVRDEKTGESTLVKVTDTTKIKSKRFFGAGNTYASDLLVRGLDLRVEGRGDQAGALVANSINIDTDSLRAAQGLQARVAPVEGRVAGAEERITAAEQNAQRLSGQLDELVAISNAARGGATAAQATADAAVAGVNATNARITELDDFNVQNSATVNFKTGSAILSPEAKTQLDTLAQGVSNMKGYVVEVTGFADSTGDTQKNRLLSERRAETVRRYLVENHGIPLRRVLQSYGFGEAEATSVGDNKTREGRAQNRRVEVKLLVSKGLTNQVQVQPTQPTSNQ